MTEKKEKPQRSKKQKWKMGCMGILGLFIVGMTIVQLVQLRFPRATIELAGHELDVLVAKNVYHRHKGLGKRDSLENADAMLFLFGPIPGEITIVMRDMRFPIDIVWLNAGEVVDIAPNVPIEPNANEVTFTRYRPRTDANMVIEFPAGWVDEHGLKIGDTMTVIEE